MEHSPGFLAITEQARRRVREIGVQEVKALIDNGAEVELIDVREDRERDAGYIPTSRHIGRGVLERDVEREIPDRDTPIILYCGGGFRSALAADSLQQMGYTNVSSMAGGVRAWRDAALPTENG